MYSLIIPIYNEERIIKRTLETLREFLKKQKEEWEVILVNDGSTDKTLEILENFKPRFFKIISYPKNRGKGYAIKKGILEANGNFIGFIDADLAYSFENLKQAFKELKNANIVIGSRSLAKINNVRTNLLRKIYGRIFNIMSNLILQMNFKDTQCGLKVFRKEVAKEIFKMQRVENYGFDTEILFIAKKKNYRIKEIPAYLSPHHSYNKSKVNLILDPIKMFLSLIKIRINNFLGEYE